MMVEAIGLLMNQLNEHIARIDGGGAGAPDQVVLGNVAHLDRQEIATELENHLVLSLVKIEEERTLRNGKNFTTGPAGEVVYRNRPLNLNLFLLFTSNYRNYGT